MVCCIRIAEPYNSSPTYMSHLTSIASSALSPTGLCPSNRNMPNSTQVNVFSPSPQRPMHTQSITPHASRPPSHLLPCVPPSPSPLSYSRHAYFPHLSSFSLSRGPKGRTNGTLFAAGTLPGADGRAVRAFIRFLISLPFHAPPRSLHSNSVYSRHMPEKTVCRGRRVCWSSRRRAWAIYGRVACI